jgi:hypothetical protein
MDQQENGIFLFENSCIWKAAMKSYGISDLLVLTIVQKLGEAHYQATGMPIGIIDAFQKAEKLICNRND